MTRLFATIFLLLLLVATAVWEQSFIKQNYQRLMDDLDALTTTITAQVETAKAAGGEAKDAKIDTPENIAKINAMYKYWQKCEKNLVMVARHFDLSQVSDALIYVKNFIEFGNAEEAFAGAQRLRYLLEAHLFNLGANFQNVI